MIQGLFLYNMYLYKQIYFLQIVYLSPQGEDELETLDDDKVYVLGVLVDKEYQPGLSLKRARQLGV